MFVFDDFELDPVRFELRRNGHVVHVEPQVFDVLAYLISNADRVVSKNELLDHIWGGRFVTESALTSRVKAVRKALGDDGKEQRLIRTVHGRGYRFCRDVTKHVAGINRASPRLSQQVGYCWAEDGARLAYATMGDGPPLVKAANWMTHLGYDLETPVWRHWLEEMSRHHQLVRYDERGCGLSDWNVATFTFEAWVRDLELVVDALGLDRFPLLGISQGAAVAVAYAVRHPERVTKLVLTGAYGRGRAHRATTALDKRAAEIDLDLARLGWGRGDAAFMQVFTAHFLPDGTKEQWESFNELQRRTISTENAVRFLETFATIDVMDIAGGVQCPALLLHARGDQRQPVAAAQELAAAIPGSELVLLDSRNHILTATEQAWPEFVATVHRFLAGD